MVHQAYVRWGNVGGGALLFGLIFAGVGMWGVIRSAPTTTWPSTEGVIDESSIQSVGRDGPDEPRLRYSIRRRADPIPESASAICS